MSEKNMLEIMGIITLGIFLFWGWYGIMPLCGFLFALGGYKNKLWRRLGISIVALGVAVFGFPNLEVYRYILTPILYFIVLSLPYGENHSDLQRIITGALFGLCSAIYLYPDILGIALNTLITCLGFQIIWYLSNKKGLTWKVCEFLIGLLMGITMLWRKKKEK